MQGIYTYTPETNCVPREYSVAAILLLLFMVLMSLVSVLNLLYFYISTFRSMCAVPSVAVFCSSLIRAFLVSCSRIF
jgi:ABC-type transport system involved in multi-copper enzyme maturation permease subunit